MSAKSNQERGRDARQRHPSEALSERLLPDRVARGSSGQAREDPSSGIPSAAPVQGLLPEKGTLESSSGQAREIGRNALLPPPSRLRPVSGASQRNVQVGGARESPSVNSVGEYISARGLSGSTGRPPAGLTARQDVIAEGSACSSAVSMGDNAGLIQRVADNTATPADMDLLNQKLLDHDIALYRELQRGETECRREGRVVQADRLRSIIAKVLLHSRSHPSEFVSEGRGTGDPGETVEQAEARRVGAALAVAQLLADTIQRVAHGTVSKAQKRAFMYDLLVSEELFERVSRLQTVFSQSNAKADQDKAKRLGRVLNECNETLLRIHKDAAGAGNVHMNPVLLGSNPSGRGGAGTNTSRASAAGASEQFDEDPAREEASAPSQTSIRRRRASIPLPPQLEAASESAQDPFVQEVRRRGLVRAAAADAQRPSAGITAALEQTRLNEAQQGVQESQRSSGSRGAPKSPASTNPKKAKKGRSKK